MPRKVSSARTTAAPAPSEPASVLDRILQQLAADQSANKTVRKWARQLLLGEAAGGSVGTGLQESDGRGGGPPEK
jgi:hypothetical protein